MATVGTPVHSRHENLKLHRLYVSSISDTNTITTGIPGIQRVEVHSQQSTAAGSRLAITNATRVGAAKRVQAFITNVATGQITFDMTGVPATCVLHVYGSR